MNTIIGLSCLLAVAVTLAALATPIAKSQPAAVGPVGRWDRLLLVVGVLLMGALLLRAHEDVFTGLDNSGYRLMAKALSEGRALQGADFVLLEAPTEVRNALMLLPHMEERNTRDRSFLVRSLDGAKTEPFFYPLLPLCAVGLDRILPRVGIDYVVPAVGLAFACLLLAVSVRRGSVLGWLLAVALLVGSPLPVWLFRGFFVESVGGILVALAALAWHVRPAGRPVTLWAYFALGLAVSFHPVMIVLSLPLLLVLVLDPSEPTRRGVWGLALFGAGFAVLLAMTRFACAPYGELSVANWVHNFTVSASHRLVTIFGLLALVFLLAAVIGKAAWRGRLSSAHLPPRWVAVALVTVSGLPLVVILLFWSQAPLVRHGLFELWTGLHGGLALLLAFCVMTATLDRRSMRPALVVAIALIALPVFAYLKGAEQMGLWSQRRLIPFYLLLVVAVVPSAATWFGEQMARRRFVLCAVLGLGLAVAALSNPVRWPAPYLVRFDHGADHWVSQVARAIGDRPALFDYHPYSIPFAVDGKRRVWGLGERAESSLPFVLEWFRSVAATNAAVIATAYENPGVEEGIALVSEGRHSASLSRARSKWALPAVSASRTVAVELLAVAPLTSNVAPPALHKILDGGPLALRGPWGRAGVSLTGPDGVKLPAAWSREGSGVIGPVPPAGGAVRIVLKAASARGDAQTLLIQPPWSTNAVPIAIPPAYTVAEVRIARPDSARDDQPASSRTGVYRFHAQAPYDPAVEGLRGYDRDLGALIHEIDIAVE